MKSIFFISIIFYFHIHSYSVIHKYANMLYYYSVIKVVQMVKQQEVAEAMQGSTHDEEFLKVDKGPTPRSNSPTEVSVQ